MTETIIPSLVRVSLGSAIILGLTKGKLDAKPSTVYLLTYCPTRCSADCGFCSQARTSKSRGDLLSRVMWPTFSIEEVIEKLKLTTEKTMIKRICIQAINYPTVFNDVMGLINRLRSEVNIPISVSCQPLGLEQIMQLGESGVDRIGIPLDTPTEELFKKVKGELYLWERQIEALKDAIKILGHRHVSTHLIVGLGERDDELLRMIQRLVDIGVYPGLFAFTPIVGTRMAKHPRPPLKRYRKIQLAHYLITDKMSHFKDMRFDEKGFIIDFGVKDVILREVINMGTAFMTSGCPGCNRPYYNERPSGPLYNYPRKPSVKELAEIERQIIGRNDL